MMEEFEHPPPAPTQVQVELAYRHKQTEAVEVPLGEDPELVPSTAIPLTPAGIVNLTQTFLHEIPNVVIQYPDEGPSCVAVPRLLTAIEPVAFKTGLGVHVLTVELRVTDGADEYELLAV